MLEYQTAVVRRDFEVAASILPSVPHEEHNRIARFLEAQGFKEEALQVATDPEHQFELAISLNKLQAAYEYTLSSPTEAKWKQIADMAMLASNIALAEECLVRAADLSGLLLLYSSTGHAQGMDRLADLAKTKGKLNIAFIAYFLRGRTADCLQLLVDADRTPEAAFLSRTFLPSRMAEVVGKWKETLKAVNPKAAESIADPLDYPNLFDGLDLALSAEEWLKGHVLQEQPASIYPDHALDNESDLLEHMRTLATQQPEEAAAGEAAAGEAAGGAPEATGGEEVAADEDDDGAEPPMLDAAEEVEEAEAPKPEEADAAPQAVDLEAELAASLGADGDEADLDAELDAELS